MTEELVRLKGDIATVELYAAPPGSARWDAEIWAAPGTVVGAFLVDAFEPSAFYAGNDTP